MVGVVHALHRGRILNTHLHCESGRACTGPRARNSHRAREGVDRLDVAVRRRARGRL